MSHQEKEGDEAFFLIFLDRYCWANKCDCSEQDTPVPGYLRPQPILPYFLRTRLNDPAQAPQKQAIDTAFCQYYEQLGRGLCGLLESKDPQERQLGLGLTRLEYENLTTALRLALDEQRPAFSHFRPLFEYLEDTQQVQEGLTLSQYILQRLEAYPKEMLENTVANDHNIVIDHMADRQLELKHYAEAERSYKRALAVLENRKDIDTQRIRKGSASLYHQLGRVAQEQRQWEQAQGYYEKS
jgi:tetratricopeptide (TPR) repeat protein